MVFSKKEIWNDGSLFYLGMYKTENKFRIKKKNFEENFTIFR